MLLLLLLLPAALKSHAEETTALIEHHHIERPGLYSGMPLLALHRLLLAFLSCIPIVHHAS